MSNMPVFENPCGAYSRYELTKHIHLDRLGEICQAEREGRCVVLPCKVGDKPYRKQTNADKIRNMSDDELAKFLLSWIDCDNERHLCCPTERGNFGKCDGRCVNGRINWLRQPVKEETE